MSYIPAVTTGLLLSAITAMGPDGIFDPAFNPAKGIGTDVYSIIPLPAQQLLIGGGFRNIDGNGQSGLARLNSDGNLDLSFQIGRGADSSIYALALQSGKNFLIGGSFQRVDEQLRSHVARVLNEIMDSRIEACRESLENRINLNIFAAAHSRVALEVSADLLTWISQSEFIVSSNGFWEIPVVISNAQRQFYRASYK